MNITVKDLLDAGVHFGHQTRRWNPKSKPFVYDHRSGVSIIDLEKTYAQLEKAVAFIEEVVADNKDIMFIGTKRQAQEILREAATTCGMPFCVNRWLGGTLTNFETILTSLKKYKKFLNMESSGELDKLYAKEAAAIRREMSRMNRNFEGIKDISKLPGAVFIVDNTQAVPSISQAQRMKKLSREKKLTGTKMREIMGEIKKGEITRVMFNNEQLYRYFPKSYTPAEMKEEILSMLNQWKPQKTVAK